MKIAILTPTFNYYSGIDRVAQRQAEDYTKKGHDVTVVCLQGEIKSKDYKVVELGTPKNSLLQKLHRLVFFLDFKRLGYYKNLKNFDIVISHYYPMNLLAHVAKRKYKTRIKYFYHSHYRHKVFREDPLIHKIYMYFFLKFSNWSLKNVDKVYCVSEFVKREMIKQGVIRRGIPLEVVKNKIDTKRFNKNVKGDRIIEKYNLRNKKVFLYVGRIAPHKRIELIIKSFAKRKEYNPNSKLIIVGKPTFKRYFKKLRKLADKDVIFTGFVDDRELPEYYAACDYYVTASYDECFNMPAVEAQACGKPVIAFEIGSHPEVINKKKGGILIPEGNFKEFTNSIINCT